MNAEVIKWLPNEKASVVWEGEKYDYQYICKRVLCIAQELSKIAGTEKNVGIYMKRCPDVMFSMLASLISGNVYVPIDTIMPQKRVDYILENADVTYVLTNTEYKDIFSGKKVILVDKIFDNPQSEVAKFAENKNAYIIYTSGSTGLPKGVCISKENLQTFITGVCEKIDFKEGTSIACLTSYSFDIFFLESLMALHEGLEIYFANEHQKNNPVAGLKYLIKNNIEMLQITPSRIQQYINYDSKMDFLRNVKILMVGGEEMSKTLLGKLQSGAGCRIYNMYGPTETTIWSAIGDVTSSQEVHVGEALKDTELCIIDEEMNVCGVGVKGELCISGKLLSKGYYNNEEMTNKKFIIMNNRKVYRTGDIAHISENNKLYIHGRIDYQVKIRGYRIEVDEVENAIRSVGVVDNVAVLAINVNEDGDRRLVAFYTAKDEQPDIEELKTSLMKFLPQYMIPEQLYKIEEFPLTVSGKIDRNKVIIEYLRVQNAEANAHLEDDELDEIEKSVIEIIKKSLNNKNVYVNKESDLAAIGVDSISFVKIIVDIECEFGVEFDVEELFDSQTNLRTVGEWLGFIKKIISS
nr:non-ribosomal peptide synthetase [uncultured Acetatifactor sp.]